MKNLIRTLIAGIYILQLSAMPISAEDPAYMENDSIPSLVDVKNEGGNVVISMTQLMPYKTNLIPEQSKLIVEIQGAIYKANFNKKNVESPLINRIRGYQFKENPLVARVVLDLKGAVDYKAFEAGSNIVISLKENKVLTKQVDSKKESKKESNAKFRTSKRDLLSSLPREVVTLDFEGADIRDVIRLMSETSNINMIHGPEVSGTISIHLKRVPFDEAFRTILNLKGLVPTQLGRNIIRITTPDLVQKEQAKAIMFTKSIPINYLKAAEMQKHLQAVMSSSGRKGTITVVEESNSIVLTDTAEGISQAERLVDQLDIKPAQVMIESRIVEIALNNGLDIGVQWEFADQDTGKLGEDKFSYLGLIPGDQEDARISHSYTNPNTLVERTVGAATPANQGTGVSLPGPSSTGITFGFVNDTTVFSATLAALISESKAKILSAPKVVTVNGKEAKIEAVEEIPFRTSTVSGTGVVSNSFVNVSAGIILTVTPTINAENQITLNILPESSLPTQESTEAGPIIRSRSAQTTVIVKDGDTLVIGGLIDDQDNQSVEKVPLLGDIPILGAFFRRNVNRKIRRELLVFVTPRIVRD